MTGWNSAFSKCFCTDLIPEQLEGAGVLTQGSLVLTESKCPAGGASWATCSLSPSDLWNVLGRTYPHQRLWVDPLFTSPDLWPLKGNKTPLNLLSSSSVCSSGSSNSFFVTFPLPSYPSFCLCLPWSMSWICTSPSFSEHLLYARHCSGPGYTDHLV